MKLRLGIALSLCPALAHAHLISTGLGPVYDGITHFALTPEDLLPAVALAVFAGLRGKAHARRAILVLPMAWLLAGMAGASVGIAVPDALAWLPLLVMGGLVAADPRLSPRATTAIAAVLGVVLGYANGCAMAQAGAGTRGIAGIAAAVFVVATLVSAGAAAWQAGWMRIVWRVAGSWIAAGGLLLLGWSLRAG
jgi:hydrogenase/urease accessory protein HupE